MTIYIILLIYIWIIGYCFRQKIKNRKYFLSFAFAAMALVLGLRGPSVGEDTSMYLSIAKATNNMSFSYILKSFPRTTWSVDQWGYHNTASTGFMLWTKVIMSIFKKPQALLIATSIIICIGFAKFIYDNTNEVFLATYVFLADSVFMMSFNGMRQCFAMSIAIHSYTFFKEKKFFNGIICIAIATFIHITSLSYLILLPIIAIKDKKREAKYIVAVLVLSPFILNILQRIVSLFSSYYGAYFKTTFWQGSLGGTIFLWIFIAVVGVYCYIIKKKELDNNDYILIYLILIYFTLEMAGIGATMVSRLALYYRAFLMLYFPQIVERLKRKDRNIVRFLIFILLTAEYLSYAHSSSRAYLFFWL